MVLLVFYRVVRRGCILKAKVGMSVLKYSSEAHSERIYFGYDDIKPRGTFTAIRVVHVFIIKKSAYEIKLFITKSLYYKVPYRIFKGS